MALPTVLDVLKFLYYDDESPVSFQSASRLYSEFKSMNIKNLTCTKTKIQEFLDKQFVYVLYKQKRLKYKRNRYSITMAKSSFCFDIGFPPKNCNNYTENEDYSAFVLFVGKSSHSFLFGSVISFSLKRS